MLLYDLNISRERKRERKRGRPSDDSNILERLIEKVEKSSFSFASLFDRVRRRAKRNSQSTGPLWWSNCVVPELSGFYRCFHIVHDAFSFFLAFAQPTRFLKLSDRFRARARARTRLFSRARVKFPFITSNPWIIQFSVRRLAKNGGLQSRASKSIRLMKLHSLDRA